MRPELLIVTRLPSWAKLASQPPPTRCPSASRKVSSQPAMSPRPTLAMVTWAVNPKIQSLVTRYWTRQATEAAEPRGVPPIGGIAPAAGGVRLGFGLGDAKRP